jgi:hypothetical protein
VHLWKCEDGLQSGADVGCERPGFDVQAPHPADELHLTSWFKLGTANIFYFLVNVVVNIMTVCVVLQS